MVQTIIRKVSPSDIKNIFILSNTNYVRTNSIQQHTILWKEHENWFNKELINNKNFFYVIETINKEFVGQIRLNYLQEKHYIISITLLEKFHNQHIGSKNLTQLFNMHKDFTFIAYIKEDNYCSLHFFKKLNFSFDSKKIINNTTFLIFKREYDEYHSNL